MEKIKSFGLECLPFKADISNFNEAEELIKTAKNIFGNIEVLVNLSLIHIYNDLL